jgi:dinuclear metal center YbgI/SA1388 family protein
MASPGRQFGAKDAPLAGVPLQTVVAYLDGLLRTAEVPDYGGAVNGLQLANRAGAVGRVAAAVDLSRPTVSAAVQQGASLLVVHHGMFWAGAQPITGPSFERLHALVTHDIAVYASHLPLDAHPTLGNNALLAAELGLTPSAGFARYKTVDVGVSGEADVETAELVQRASAFAERHGGTVRHTSVEPARRTRRWALCTGAGASTESLREAAQLGVDTLIVGEGPHHTAVDAEERGIVVIYAGHYATETLGVQALAGELERTFGLPWSFISAPTGL